MKTTENPRLAEKTVKKVSKMLKLLSDPTRMNILYLLEGKELNVGTIAQCLDMEQSAVSHQLKLLKEARLIKSRRNGKQKLYSQTDEHVYKILNQVIEHAEETEND